MVTITIEFEYEGNKHILKAMLNNDLSELSTSKKNDATEINEDFGDEYRWSMLFDKDDLNIEAVMYRNAEGDKAADVEYVIIWNGDAIEAEIDAKSSVKRS